jgi:PAS domain S-box-containing protein
MSGNHRHRTDFHRAGLPVQWRSRQEQRSVIEFPPGDGQPPRTIEQRLHASHATLAATINASPLAIFAVDRQGRVLLWNPAAERTLGWTAQEVLGQPPPHVLPESESAWREVLNRELQGEAFAGYEAVRQTKSGQMLDVTVWTAPLELDGEGVVGAVHLLADITQRKQLEKSILQLNASLEDRVARRTAELERTNRELEDRRRENELFVYSVSHDLRSPLVNLQGFSEELRRSCQDLRELMADSKVPAPIRERGAAIVDSDIAEAVQYINSAVTRLGNIIAALLRLSRAGRIEYQPQMVDMQTLMQQVVTSHGLEISHTEAEVTLSELLPAWCDAGAIEQVFANLLQNALCYRAAGRKATIKLGMAAADKVCPDAANRRGDPETMRTYYLSDNGLGIPAALHRKVFQAFQRFHPQAGSGEGIGLTLVRRVVERNGGQIWFESEEGIGTTFYVSLLAQPAPSPPGGNEE